MTKVYLKVLIKFYPYWLRDLGPYFSPNDYRTRHASNLALKGGKEKGFKIEVQNNAIPGGRWAMPTQNRVEEGRGR